MLCLRRCAQVVAAHAGPFLRLERGWLLVHLFVLRQPVSGRRSVFSISFIKGLMEFTTNAGTDRLESLLLLLLLVPSCKVLRERDEALSLP